MSRIAIHSGELLHRLSELTYIENVMQARSFSAVTDSLDVTGRLRPELLRGSNEDEWNVAAIAVWKLVRELVERADWMVHDGELRLRTSRFVAHARMRIPVEPPGFRLELGIYR